LLLARFHALHQVILEWADFSVPTNYKPVSAALSVSMDSKFNPFMVARENILDSIMRQQKVHFCPPPGVLRTFSGGNFFIIMFIGISVSTY